VNECINSGDVSQRRVQDEEEDLGGGGGVNSK